MAAGVKITQDEAIERFRSRGFVLLSGYANANTKVSAECIAHGITGQVIPANIFRGQGMACCKHGKITLSASEVQSRIDVLGYELVGGYAGTADEITLFCPRHNETHTVSARGVISEGKGLMCCAPEKIRQRMTGRSVSESARANISKWQQNGNAPWSGKKLTDQHRAHISAGLNDAYASSQAFNVKLAKTGKTSGKPGWFYIAKMGNGLLKFGSTVSKDHRERFRHFKKSFGCDGALVLKCRVSDAGNYEAMMMEMHREHWVTGEFFNNWLGV